MVINQWGVCLKCNVGELLIFVVLLFMVRQYILLYNGMVEMWKVWGRKVELYEMELK